MRTLGFLHTSPVHVPTFEALVQELDAGATSVHEVHPEFLDEARRTGPSAELESATLSSLTALVAAGADVVVCTCSTLGEIAEGLQAQLSVPVLRVDRPMARAAVGAGGRIGVVAALASTVGPTSALLDEEARRAGVTPTIVSVCVPEAWSCFEAGDLDGYLRQITAAARATADEVDVIVLAQASMLGAVPQLADLAVPVLASPPLAVRYASLVAQRDSSTMTS